MPAIELVRFFLAAFFLSVALFYFARIFLLSKHLSRSAVYAGRPGSRHFIVHRLFAAFRATILVVCLIRVPFPAFDNYLGPIEFLTRDTIILTGSLLMLLSTVGIVRINLFLKNNWRSGARPDDTTELITSGPFGVSQNPMMLLVTLAQLGFFLALPTVFSLVCLVVGVWAVVSQVDLERRELGERFGDDYLRYAQKTPRWMFFKSAPKNIHVGAERLST